MKNSNIGKIPEDVFLKSLKSSNNIRESLINLGLVPAGSNYNRAKQILKKYNMILN